MKLYEMNISELLKKDRHWYNPKTEETITVNRNHTDYIYDNPEVFGISPEDLPEDRKEDYDDRVLWMAMENGWIRLRVDRRKPDWNSNIEGSKLRLIRKTVKDFAEAMPGLLRLIVSVRTGPGDREGTPYILKDEDIEFFIKKGSPPRSSKLSEEELQEMEEIQRLAGISTYQS